MNLVSYFEIPVKDIELAVQFYQQVFGYALERESVDGNEIAFFPYNPNSPGASGALAQGESYTPSPDGARIYFDVVDIQHTIATAISLGGKERFPATQVGNFGVVAEIEDLDGNCIGLHTNS